MSGKPLKIEDLGVILRRRKWHVAIPAAVILLLSGALAYLLPPAYLSTATVLIEQQEIPDNLVTSTITGYASERIEMIRNRVMTRDSLWAIVEKFDLYPGKRSPETQEDIIAEMRESILMDMLSADAVDSKGRPTSTTIAFTISYENETPKLAQDVTAELVELYLNENRRSRRENTQQISSFLNDEAQRLRTQISDLETKVAAFKVKNAGYLPDAFKSTSSSLDSARQQLGQLDANLSSLESRYSFLKSQFGTSGQLAKARMELAAAREKYSDIHPDVLRLKRSVEALETQVNQGGGSPVYGSAGSDREDLVLKAELQQILGEISSVRSQRADQNRKITEYQSRLTLSPGVEQEYSALTRDLDHATSKYKEIMDKLTSAQLSAELEREQKGERFTLLEAANYPSSPSKPNIPGIILLGVTLALGVGVGIAALAESLDRRIFGPNDLVAVFKAPPLAIIPEITG